MEKNKRSLFFLPLIIVLGVSCGLFNNLPENDLEKKMDDAIAWAKAMKIIVTVAYPPEWGVSPQLGTGRCGDTRVGYTFELDFTPNSEYTLLGWRAYRTSDLTDDWIVNPARYFDSQKKASQIEEVILPIIPDGGGTGKFIVKTPANITLIPFCRAQPRIVSSTPDNNTGYYSRVNPITISFAASLRADTIKFDANNITITYRVLDSETGEPTGYPIRLDGIDRPDLISLYFKEPNLADTRTIIIEPLIDLENLDNLGAPDPIFGAPENAEITLTLGRGIETALGNRWEKPVAIVWRTKEGGTIVSDWEAIYDNGQIDISWEVEGGEGIAEVYYSIDTGSELTAEIASNGIRCVIPDVDKYDPLDIDGSVHRYTIYIGIKDIKSGNFERGDPIYIWNIPGIRASMDRPIIELESPDDIKQMYLNDSDQCYILAADDITLDDYNWLPIGTDAGSNAFKGMLCGMGKTIKFSQYMNNFLGAQYKGLFGYLDGAVIYDLTVEYGRSIDVADNGANPLYMGGLAGYAGGNTVISNCMVKGSSSPSETLKLTSLSAVPVIMGGMVGRIADQTVVMNSTAAINVEVYKETAGNTNIGGFTGHNTSLSNPSLSGIAVNGNVTVTKSGSGDIYAAGIDASHFNSNMEYLTYAGEIDITKNGSAGQLFVGGIVGVFSNSSSILKFEECIFDTGSITVSSGATGELYVGGIVGGPLSASQGYCSLHDCVSRVAIDVTGAGATNVGGIAGSLQGLSASSMALISDCTYETGKIRATVNSVPNRADDMYVGGLIGLNKYSSITGCVVKAEIEATLNGGQYLWAAGLVGKTDGTVLYSSAEGTLTTLSEKDQNAGGLAGSTESGGVVSHCSADMDVYARNGAYTLRAGGLIGFLRGNMAEHSSAAGNVDAANTTGLLFAGGLVGYTQGSITQSHAAGYVIANTGSGDKWAGGLVGLFEKADGGIEDCSAAGVVTFNAVSGNHFAGGLVGEMTTSRTSPANRTSPAIYISGCYATGNVNAAGDSLRAGGLAGQGTVTRFENSYATGKVTANAAGGSSAGGLLGSSSYTVVSIEKCYAIGDVDVECCGNFNVGGLAGYFRGDVLRSWAEGDVTITQIIDTDATINAGGLIGHLNEANKKIANCYALGDVTVDYKYTRAAALAAGGIIGNLTGASSGVEYCFAAGSVEQKSGTTNWARTGGIQGTNSAAYQVQHTAALGNTVTATSYNVLPERFNVNRIGYKGSINFNNNYALDTMRIGSNSGGYGAVFIPSTISTGTTGNEDGENISDVQRKSSSFWTNTMGFNSAAAGTGVWDFSDVDTVGHPKLVW